MEGDIEIEIDTFEERTPQTDSIQKQKRRKEDVIPTISSLSRSYSSKTSIDEEIRKFSPHSETRKRNTILRIELQKLIEEEEKLNEQRKEMFFVDENRIRVSKTNEEKRKPINTPKSKQFFKRIFKKAKRTSDNSKKKKNFNQQDFATIFKGEMKKLKNHPERRLFNSSSTNSSKTKTIFAENPLLQLKSKQFELWTRHDIFVWLDYINLEVLKPIFEKKKILFCLDLNMIMEDSFDNTFNEEVHDEITKRRFFIHHNLMSTFSYFEPCFVDYVKKFDKKPDFEKIDYFTLETKITSLIRRENILQKFFDDLGENSDAKICVYLKRRTISRNNLHQMFHIQVNDEESIRLEGKDEHPRTSQKVFRKNNEFTLCFSIGNVYLEWCETNIIIPRKSSQNYIVCKIPETEEEMLKLIERNPLGNQNKEKIYLLFSKLIRVQKTKLALITDMIIQWNKTKTFKLKSLNSGHFIDEILNIIFQGVDNTILKDDTKRFEESLTALRRNGYVDLTKKRNSSALLGNKKNPQKSKGI